MDRKFSIYELVEKKAGDVCRGDGHQFDVGICWLWNSEIRAVVASGK